MWLDLAIVLVAAAGSAFGASFLSSAWRKRHKVMAETLRIEAMLPGFDCGLCGFTECRYYAEAIDLEGANPALCLPGGERLERRLRASLDERPGDTRGRALRAVVRCGGRSGVAVEVFSFDGRSDCGTAVDLFGGPKSCKDGCLGLGTCAAACPVGAIRVANALAVVNPAICTGCGECAKVCPNGIISMLPKEQSWYVACSSRRAPEARAEVCTSACNACGDCSARSGRSEFILHGRLAKENHEAVAGKWQEIAECCPTRAIVCAGSEKKRRSPLPGHDR